MKKMNKISLLRILTFVIITLLLAACSSDDKKTAEQAQTEIPIPDVTFTADLWLPEDLDSSGIVRVGSVTIVLPDQAVQHFRQQAPIYRSYSFVGQAGAEYRVNDRVARAEIAQFATAEDAYGFYANYRPGFGGVFRRMGGECYEQENLVRFVMGDCVVTLQISADSLSAFKAAQPLALSITALIGGRTSIPSYYLLFPYRDKIDPSNAYVPFDFLNVAGLNKVFTCDYRVAGDTVRLFFTMDEGGGKFMKLSELAKESGKMIPKLRGFDYDADFVLAFEHPEHGIIVAGLVSKKLVGIINYNPKKTEKLIKGWVTGLK